MHTAIVIGVGFLLLGVCAGLGRMLGVRRGWQFAAFLPLWAVGAAINLWFGLRAGYTFGEELPMFGVVFGVPGVVALFKWATAK